MSGLQSVWCELCNEWTHSPIHHRHRALQDGGVVDDRRKQVGGDHYAKHKIQPWDVIEDWGLDFFAGNALKYLLRDKGTRLEDLQKLQHYVEKMIEREQAR